MDEDTDAELFEGTLRVSARVIEDDETTARELLADKLELIAKGLREGRTAARVMHPNGHAIGEWQLI